MIDKSKVSAVMLSSESDVPIPSRRKPTSLISQIAALQPGENVTRTMEIVGDLRLSEIKQCLSQWKRGLANSVHSSVTHAKKRVGDGADYTIETSHVLTTAGNLYILAIVTRVNNE